MEWRTVSEAEEQAITLAIMATMSRAWRYGPCGSTSLVRALSVLVLRGFRASTKGSVSPSFGLLLNKLR
jgi:hypothetical protein